MVSVTACNDSQLFLSSESHFGFFFNSTSPTYPLFLLMLCFINAQTPPLISSLFSLFLPLSLTHRHTLGDRSFSRVAIEQQKLNHSKWIIRKQFWRTDQFSVAVMTWREALPSWRFRSFSHRKMTREFITNLTFLRALILIMVSLPWRMVITHLLLSRIRLVS